MSRRRRAALLAGLAILLGALAAGDVARREAALREGVGPTVRVLVAADDIAKGRPLAPDRLALRRVPARWAPEGAFTDPSEVTGLTAVADLPRGADITTASVATTDAAGPDALGLRPSERAAQLVATAPPGGVRSGALVDVVVTRDGPGGGDGSAEVAVTGAEVLEVAPAAAAERGDGAPRVAATLRVTLRQALLLTTAEAYARDVRLLARPIGQPSSAP